ncbi:ATP-binding cassette domain-containing protein [Idiomarina loihiensis]|jgi:ATP-binding cassette subfamily F protein 3|uniref:Probable ATP-binding protein YheS n=1 Tax=Idiomarina loihiensis (strain ATCC BAA-735 / DSM 15497 / L2-TR) TaxID=283942 RepID=Q5QW94_IDILO|nr:MULTISPECIES: ATP-binding cassette domain-containing protein [Idiomarina]NWO01775.1 ATP-binding cassette domain-containing protein [Idiomarinaceae bacterium]AAV81169.1 ATPase component of ABC transporters with duplicated ATPase domains [Idiomarina loihiensis L2TR]AGM35194.1 ABC transporter ATPase [Idiomarina loihiensis GSL 199]MRJ44636.1 ATP-binding cassette domain-containing protein [Idiomarina loihiensis]UTW32339.1 ATP-binding cassette domain-containing protein [Idiomarina loihiensis]|tara:strand:- start:136859 stop:138772 length:1914 start_codon:yes stop_codon:yes gene_type:complete
MIRAEAITLLRGGDVLFEDSDLQVFPGHRVGLVGRNGCGKSSLFAMLRGELSADSGNIHLPAEWRIASVAQDTPALDKSAIDYVMDGDAEFRQLEAQLAQAESDNNGEAIAHCHDKLASIGAYDIQPRTASLMAGLGFTQEQLQQPVKAFSGGWRMRLNLAQVLIARADLMLLDEPTNHLDVDAIFWLESWLKQYDGTLLLISHDRDFLDSVTTDITHIEHKKLNSYRGNYSLFERQRAEHMAQQQSEYEKAQVMRQHLQAYVDRFRYKASKAKQAQSRLKAIEKLPNQAPLRAESGIDFHFLTPEKLPNPLLTLRDAKAGYGDTTILEQIKLNLVPGTRLGLLGRNGAGKSTLIKLLAGELEPMAGERLVNPGLSIGYFAQHQLETLDLAASALLHLQRIDKQATEQKLRDFLGNFGFSGDQATRSVEPMSGGEKARLALALIIYQRPNLLLLDEPTNHLDLGLRDALVAALQEYEGALIVVSHDRHLLRTTVDEFCLVADGKAETFDGDLDAYHDWLQQQAANDKRSEQPATRQRDDRKQQKRKEAEARQKTKPLRQQIEKAEKNIHSLELTLADIHEQLSDSTLYDDANKAKLQKLLDQQAQAQKDLQQQENLWMTAEEELAELTEELQQAEDK